MGYREALLNLIEVAVQVKNIPKAYDQIVENMDLQDEDYESSLSVGLDLLRTIEKLGRGV